MDADTLRLLSPVSNDVRDDGKVRRLGTVVWAMLQKIVAVALVIGVYVLPHLCQRYDCNKYSRSSLVVYLHVAAYISQIILHIIIEYKHAKHRQLGYLRFHEKTKLVRRAPSFIFAAGTLALLVMQTILVNSNGHVAHRPNLALERIIIFGVSISHEDFYSILVTVQVLLVLPFIVSYIVKIVKFNSQLPPPDVYLEEELLTSYMRHQPNAEVGVRELSPLDALLSKQADKIEYLEDHNKRLGQKLVELTQRMAGLQANTAQC